MPDQPSPAVHIITTGGTIDKVYFDALSAFEVGETAVGAMLREANVTLPVSVEPLLRKDSLDLSDDDRAAIREAVERAESRAILITHGTDTMPETARYLQAHAALGQKVVVLTGAMQPAAMRASDASFNLGAAVTALNLLEPGVYISMSARIFPALDVKKDCSRGIFEAN